MRELMIRLGMRYGSGELPTIAELRETFALSRATAFRWLADIRSARGLPPMREDRKKPARKRRPLREAHKPKHGPSHPYQRAARRREAVEAEYDAGEMMREAFR